MGNKSVINDGINGYVCDKAEEYAEHIKAAMKEFPKELAERAYQDVLEIYNTEAMKKNISHSIIMLLRESIEGKKMTPFLSIIIPIYKIKEEYLRACFDSLLKQDNDNFQIIAVDDGSPDCSGEICDEYAKKDNRIIVIHQKMQEYLLQEIMVLKRQN